MGKYGGPSRWTCIWRIFLLFLLCPIFLFQIFAVPPSWAWPPGIAISKDGTPISYEIYGEGEPTLVFVHGWCCDSRYWREQVPRFSKKYRMILVDLAGHGHSGFRSSSYSMKAFGEDVKAVAKAAAGTGEIILVGHSMGGPVIAEAARLMKDKVIGLIGVDTLENVSYRMTREEMDGMVAPFKEDFTATARTFIGQMLLPDTDASLRNWIISDMSAARPDDAISALEGLIRQSVTGEAAEIFDDMQIPVVTVNAGLWPVNYEGNRKHMRSYEAIVLKGTDHFLMLDQAERFNEALEKAVEMVAKRAPN